RREQVLRNDVEGIFTRLVQIAPSGDRASSSPLLAAAASSSSSMPAAPSSASAVPPAPPSSGPLSPPTAGAGLLSRTSLRELLLALAGERRTGTVTVTTAQGAGELRLHDGDIVDAVYLRLEGAKAVARLLGERDGSFSFLPRTPPVMRRINVP